MAGTRRKPGRMGAHIDGLREWLVGASYTPHTVRNMLKDVGRLGRWMDDVDIDVHDLDRAAISAFRHARLAAGDRRVPGLRSFQPLLEYLAGHGLLAEHASPSTPVDELLAAYHLWLLERGLADATVLRYEKLACRFLQLRFEAADTRFVADLSGADVVAFLLRESARVSVGSAKGRVAELRALLRFLHVRGLTSNSLAEGIPPVAGWHDVALPRGIAAPEVRQLLDSCDRSQSIGVRDFAILTLVARLGLRSIEVARLELGDIDWRAGEIVVRGKARRHDRLPLPPDVGDALVAYLRHARPTTSLRQVFMMSKAPKRAIRADLVSDVTRRACRRAGLPPAGAHRLRHTLATEMLRRGATLVEVSQVLRHRDLATTAIYAKVDVNTLRLVAKPWPGAAS
jgi:site-specific recombinase XerD